MTNDKRNPRVLHLTTSFPHNESGFSGLFVHQLARASEESGLSCQVLTPAATQRSAWPDAYKVCRFRYAPWRLQRLAHLPGGIPQALAQHPFLHSLLPGFLLSMAAHLVNLAIQHDVIHAHWSISGWLAVVTQPIHKKAVITTLRGSDVHKARVSPFYDKLHRTAVRGSYFTVGVSQQIVKALQNDFPEISDRFFLVPNGVGNDFFSISPSDRPPTPPVRLLFVGSLIKLKGIDLLLQSLASPGLTGEWKLTIAGDGPERGCLMQLAHSLGLSGKVSFLGTVPPLRIPSLMSEHHVLLLPSQREGRANVILEAMAAALPVLATDIEGTRELIQHGRTGWLIPWNDRSALASALNSLLCNEEDLCTVGKAARHWMRQEGMTWTESARRYRLLYEEALRAQKYSI